jgi:hypothetical protein
LSTLGDIPLILQKHVLLLSPAAGPCRHQLAERKDDTLR